METERHASQEITGAILVVLYFVYFGFAISNG